jgi:polyisoprenyl-teichoic acid--peptidoglycan teichoic acid transferase
MKNRNKKPIKKILAVFGVSVGVIAAAAGVFIFAELSKINAPEKLTEISPANEIFDTENNSDFGADVPQVNPKDVVWPSAYDPAAGNTVTGKKIINILLIGQDKRPGEKRARSDSIIIASYNKKDGSLKLISLMRDMYLPIPGYSDNRINSAYSFGGMALLDKTIENAFGVTIDGNMEVNFEGFTHLIDMLGGLDVTLDKAETAHLNNKNGWQLVPGENHLDGQQTLEYSRIRSVGNADYERTERQRTVLLNIFSSVSQLELTKKYLMLDKMLPYLTTDMKKEEILGYAYTVLTSGVKSTASHRIPEDGTYKPAMIRKMAVLVPNLAKNRALLKSYISE